jgi:2,4-diketo-3-deoxy-L-fuconate hydrolase
MKLVRYGRAGAEKPGLIDAEGKLRDLSRVVKDITPDVLAPAGLRRLRAVKPARLPLVKGKPRLGCPLAGIGKIVCIGLNYTDHAEEVGLPLPKEPTIFIKANSAISGPHDPIARPADAAKLDYEVELVAVMGREARRINEADALRHIAAYCLMNDVSERAFQMEHGGGTTKGKSADTFAPIGPWLVTADEVADPQGLTLWTMVNGERRQSGRTKHMVFPVGQLVAYVSRFMSLRVGDLLSTGTPAGVGHGVKPPRYLEPGDVVEMGIDGLGTQRHVVIEAKAARRPPHALRAHPAPLGAALPRQSGRRDQADPARPGGDARGPGPGHLLPGLRRRRLRHGRHHRRDGRTVRNTEKGALPPSEASPKDAVRAQDVSGLGPRPSNAAEILSGLRGSVRMGGSVTSGVYSIDEAVSARTRLSGALGPGLPQGGGVSFAWHAQDVPQNQ